VAFSLDPSFSPGLAPDEVRPIGQIRISVAEYPGGNLLKQTTFEVDPEADEWALTFPVPIPGEGSVEVTISLELMSSGSGGAMVEWSGRAGPLTLAAGSRIEVHDVTLVRGPLANLAVTGLAIRAPSLELREGQDLPLQAQVSTSSPGESPTVFWRSMNTSVATVSGTGLVQGIIPGTAGITAASGSEADTAVVTVLPAPASISLSPHEGLVNALSEEISFQATILDTRGDPVPQDQVTWSAADPGILQPLGEGRFLSVSRGTTLVTAASTLDPDISGSAEVVVRQVVAAVDVLPAEAAVFIGESLQFEAVALDDNQNPIQGMSFSWSTPHPQVASLDATGLATGEASGSATIQAQAELEFLGPAFASSGAPGSGDRQPVPTPGTTGFATLEVLPNVALVEVTPSAYTFRSLGQVRTFTAQAYGLDQSGEPTILLPLTHFTWESENEAVVGVDGLGVTADTAFIRSEDEGRTTVRASIQGISGSSSVLVDQRVASIDVLPSFWEFQPSASGEGYFSKEFTARGYDALGNRVSGISFNWSTSNEECFPIGNTTATSAWVDAQCSCEEGTISASYGARSGTASVRRTDCELPAGACPARNLRPGSPFGLGGFDF